MVSLFLVEDEKISRESIRNNVAWAQHGIAFLGDAPDGELALPQILEHKPDIVLTDIKMPFMDGLALSKIVRARLPETQIIILSGYNEFDYARQAISLGIREYLLKPVSSTDICEVVCKVKLEIETLRQQKHEQAQRQTLHQDALRQLFWSGIFSGYLKNLPQIMERAEQLGIALRCALYRVVILRIPAEQAPLSAARLAPLLAPPEGILAVPYGSEELAYLLQADSSAQLAQVRTALAQWCEACAAQLRISPMLRDGEEVNRITDICKSYMGANAPGLRLSEGQGVDFSPSAAFQRADFLEFLRTGKSTMVDAFWQHYAPSLRTALPSMIYRCYLHSEIAFVVTQFTEESGIAMPEALKNADKLEAAILNNDSDARFFSFVTALSRELIASRDAAGINRFAPAALLAREYIDCHYAESELSLSVVAEAVCVSPNYLSTMFKERIGTNFSEYLTEVRIRQAKRLLINTDLRASEVAGRVGYQNTNYFGMIFKKVTGVSPSQYQREKAVP